MIEDKDSGNLIQQLDSTEFYYIFSIEDLKKALTLNQERYSIITDLVLKNSILNFKQKKFDGLSNDFILVVKQMCCQEKLEQTSDFIKLQQTAVIINEEISELIYTQVRFNKQFQNCISKDKSYKSKQIKWGEIPSLLGIRNSIETFFDNHATISVLITSQLIFWLVGLQQFHDLINSETTTQKTIHIIGVLVIAILYSVLVIVFIIKHKNIQAMMCIDKAKRIKENFLFRKQFRYKKSSGILAKLFGVLWEIFKG